MRGNSANGAFDPDAYIPNGHDDPAGADGMAVRTRFVVQAFEHVGGRLVPTRRSDAPSEGFALKQAEAMAGRVPGAAALKLVTEATGEVTTILGAFGDVPDDVSEGLAGG